MINNYCPDSNIIMLFIETLLIVEKKELKEDSI